MLSNVSVRYILTQYKLESSKIVKFCLWIQVQAQTGKMMSHKRCATTFNFFLGKLQGDKLLCAIITPIILRASRMDEKSVHVFWFRKSDKSTFLTTVCWEEFKWSWKTFTKPSKGRGLVGNFKLWVLDLNFCHGITNENWCFFNKVHQKPWMLAPTLSKTVGAIAPTVPILTRALHIQRNLKGRISKKDLVKCVQKK